MTEAATTATAVLPLWLEIIVAVLAMIVCITPGTAWAELSLDRSVLLLHVLELDDAATVIADVKRRYEAPLMEIFE